jgi:uncharacterized MAPEG superfamily protein
MNTELCYLATVTTFTAVMWIPYILNRIMVRGLADAVGYPADPKPVAPWAQRMQAAHANAVENLVVFAALVLVADAVGATGGCTAAAATVYFWARVAHYLAYTFAIPWVRTLAFAAGWAAQIAFAWQIFTAP